MQSTFRVIRKVRLIVFWPRFLFFVLLLFTLGAPRHRCETEDLVPDPDEWETKEKAKSPPNSATKDVSGDGEEISCSGLIVVFVEAELILETQFNWVITYIILHFKITPERLQIITDHTRRPQKHAFGTYIHYLAKSGSWGHIYH